MRVYLGGEGEAVPLEALPDLVSAGKPVALELPNGVPFIPQQFIDIGFEAYEVIVIGGAGGNGGLVQYDAVRSYGGAGGGGGLQIVSGLLVDLPSSVPVVVGAAGANGADGILASVAYGGIDGHGTMDPGHPGSDGGYSSFGGALCRASGGKGGLLPWHVKPSLVGYDGFHYGGFYEKAPILSVWDPTAYPPATPGTTPGPTGYWVADVAPGGNGGDGGKGGRTIAGGGAVGGKSTPRPFSPFEGNHANAPTVLTPVADGSYDPITGIGEGGGGGRGGTSVGASDTTIWSVP